MPLWIELRLHDEVLLHCFTSPQILLRRNKDQTHLVPIKKLKIKTLFYKILH